jgi:hypothetical protein
VILYGSSEREISLVGDILVSSSALIMVALPANTRRFG